MRMNGYIKVHRPADLHSSNGLVRFAPGIMTVPVLPCDQTRMSLFQDLKLKRRKVDSRCSSDGESVADTSTSSPDSGASATGCSSSPSNHCDITMSPCKDRESPEPIAMCNNPHSIIATPAPVTSLQIRQKDQPCNLDIDGVNCRVVCGRESPTLSVDEQMDSSSSLEMTCSTRQDTTDSAKTFRYFSSSPLSSTYHTISTAAISSNEKFGHFSDVKHYSGASSLTNTRSDSVATGASPVAVSSAAVSYWNQVAYQLNGLRPSAAKHVSPGSSSKHLVKDNNSDGARASVTLSELTTKQQNRHHQHQQQQQQQQQQQRQLHVVMGDHGGIRTMMWTSNSEPTSPCQIPPQALRSTKEKCVASPTSQLLSNEERVGRSSVEIPLNLESGQFSNSPNASSTTQDNHSVQSPSRMSPSDSNQLSRPQFHRGSLLQHQLQIRSPTLNSLDHLKDGSVSPSLQQFSPSRGVLTSTTSFSTPKTCKNTTIYDKPLNGASSLVSLDMNEFWNQTQALNLTTAGFSNRNSSEASTSASQQHYDDQEEHPMICMICDDKATGLHYGIITCEGCKGFFKRTVQNKRVYSCVADGNCEITKAQRNRCQFCRFQKCLSMGMVLAAVREDRMPGGRNSGAVYNLYKVKYKKHKKKQQSAASMAGFNASALMYNGNFKMESSSPNMTSDICSTVPAGLLSSGNILKTALTNPTEVDHLRHHMEVVSASRACMSFESSSSLIRTLIACDNFEDIATVQNLNEIFDHGSDISEKLCHIGETIVYKLVQWTKQLPFYAELPVPVHTQLLTNKWHELLVLTTCSYQAIKGVGSKHDIVANSNNGASNTSITDFQHEVSLTMATLQTCLSTMMNQTVSLDQLNREVGPMIEKITLVTVMLRNLTISMQEYVCLKIIALLGESVSLHPQCDLIEQRYRNCLRAYVTHEYPNQPNRFHELLARLPEVREAATLLLESKMFYVPFLLNSTVNS